MKKPEEFKIFKYDKEKFEKTGVLDCFENVYLSSMNLSKLPFQFGVVNGDFSCSNNQLTSLKGCPTKVSGDFYCNNNKLTSLEGSPSSVSGDFYCYNNKLTSLEGSPSSVSGSFDCSYNELTSLKGSPSQVSGSFYCHNNKLTSLEGLPKINENKRLYIEKNNFTVNEWIYILEKFNRKGLYKYCNLVQDNSTYELTLNNLKMKQKIISLINI